jgi:predicted nucleic acid-binding protein
VIGQVVVDASVAFKWMVNEVDSDKAEALARVWATSGVRLHGPYLLPVELSNALYKRVTIGDITLDRASGLLRGFFASRVDLLEPRDLHVRAAELATLLNQTAVYDSVYLALAEILGCDLWTADLRFFRASAQRFPAVRWIGQA